MNTDRTPQSGDYLKAVNGTYKQLPYREEIPCFGQREGHCAAMATWRVVSSALILHFCDECKARHAARMAPPEYRWTQLGPRPNN